MKVNISNFNLKRRIEFMKKFFGFVRILGVLENSRDRRLKRGIEKYKKNPLDFADFQRIF